MEHVKCTAADCVFCNEESGLCTAEEVTVDDDATCVTFEEA